MSQVLGSAGLQDYITKYEVKLEKSLAAMIAPHVWEKKKFEHFITKQNAHLCPPEAIDLLERVLVYDHAARLTCIEAMQHKYFDPVRAQSKSASASATQDASATGGAAAAWLSVKQPTQNFFD
jgi:casein kinase II subunit alpha